MKTMTRLNAFALVAVAAVALGVGTWDAQLGSPQVTASAPTAELLAPSFTGKVDTGWLPATEARREIEELGAALDRLALERGVDVRVLGSNAHLRTRSLDGARLDAPVARFVRSFEFRVSNPNEAEALRSTLASLAIDVETQSAAIDYASPEKVANF
jgi:hypothetical protein